MTDLRKLIEAVESGTATLKDFTIFSVCGKPMPNDGRAYEAYRGSLDAAKALHKALLPGWLVQELSQNSRSMGWNMLLVNPDGTYTSSHYGDVGFISCPARAWLIATLKAYEAKQ